MSMGCDRMHLMQLEDMIKRGYIYPSTKNYAFLFAYFLFVCLFLGRKKKKKKGALEN